MSPVAAGVLLTAGLVCASFPFAAAQQTGFKTNVAISGTRFLLNGQVTHPGTLAEGMLLNSRMAQAIFDDENPATLGQSAYPDTRTWDAERNVNEFIAALPSYAAKGLRAFTVNLQGGSPGWTTGNTQPNITTAYTSAGHLKPAWLHRLDRVLRAADEQGLVVIVGLFYFGQDHRLANEAAVVTAVDGVTDWLVAGGYRNVLIEINNEADLYYDHAILKPARVRELITRVRQRSGGHLKVSTSLKGGSIPSSDLVSASDYILLHGNGRSASTVSAMVDQVRALSAYQANPKPIVFNEDSTKLANFDAAVAKGASWGYYDQGTNNYHAGFQSPPVNWTINTADKTGFFNRVQQATLSAPTEPPPDEPSPTNQVVSSFTLINADTGQPIPGFDPMPNGAVLALNELPTRNLNIRANTSPAIVGSVVFGLNTKPTYQVENVAPYALAGDSGSTYVAWTPPTGSYTLKATPYSSSSGGGTAGSPLQITFSVAETTPTAPRAPGNLRIVK
ncbi:MAG: hypothetical protein H0X67_00480 [Acidobacteria bacterium]|nr:hypothetical protein [Acidobacteriota bacterium]